MNSILRYVPPHRRYSSSSFRSGSRSYSPLYRRDQPFLILEDLHIRYILSNSSPLRILRTQRSLSAEDLSRRYLSTPPSPPRDLKALRSRDVSASPRSRIFLSIKLPDPPVFNGINKHIPFDNWKMRIQDKLTYNGDHFLTESFKIIYVITRLDRDAAKYTSLRRRQRSYSSISDLLNYLSDSYKRSLNMI